MDKDGLICAYLMDGKGGARNLDWDEVERWKPEQGALWLHFDYAHPQSVMWIGNKSGLEEVAVSALLTEESRPRASLVGSGILVALRGVNLSPGSDPEDMVAIRLWIDENRIISTRKRKLLSESDIMMSFEKKEGPCTTGEFVVALADRLISRMEGTIDGIQDRVDHFNRRRHGGVA